MTYQKKFILVLCVVIPLILFFGLVSFFSKSSANVSNGDTPENSYKFEPNGDFTKSKNLNLKQSTEQEPQTSVSDIVLGNPVSGPKLNWFSFRDKDGNQYNFNQVKGADTAMFYNNGKSSDMLFSGNVIEKTIDKTKFPNVNFRYFEIKLVTKFQQIN